jgi:hypothetical protein
MAGVAVSVTVLVDAKLAEQVVPVLPQDIPPMFEVTAPPELFMIALPTPLTLVIESVFCPGMSVKPAVTVIACDIVTAHVEATPVHVPPPQPENV